MRVCLCFSGCLMVRLAFLSNWPSILTIQQSNACILDQMNTSTSFLLGCLLVLVRGQIYDDEDALRCSDLDNQWSLEENLQYLWKIIRLHEIDRFAFLVGCPLIAVGQIVLIVTFGKFKLYRSSPLDIIFALFLCETIINLCLFSTAVFYSLFPDRQYMPCSFPTFCMTVALINTCFSLLEQIYLVYFLIHVILSVQRSIKKNVWFEGKVKHVIPVLASIGMTALSWSLEWMGLSQLGICQIASTRNNYQQLYFPVLQLSFSFLFVCFAFVTFRYFKKRMPQGEALSRRKYEENELISRFTIGMSLIFALFSAAMLVLFLNCLKNDPEGNLMIFATLFNLTRLAEFFYLIGVMLNYRKIGNKVKKLFRRGFGNNPKDSMVMEEKRLTSQQIYDVQDIGIKQKILDIQQEENQIDFVTITQIMTIVTGVHIAGQEYFRPAPSLPSPPKNLLFHEEVSFQIDSNSLREYEQDAQLLPRLSLLRGKVTIHAPRIFNQLQQQDRVDQIWRSFDLVKNWNQLYRIYEGNGGKSGEFFFFTSDYRFILKTINPQEFNTLLCELQLFYAHFQRNPASLIAKIYGMLTIQSHDIPHIYHILLMKNVSGCSRQQVRRIYDLKGSTHHRQILKGLEQGELESSNGVVLKDLDFRRLEGKLLIAPEIAQRMRDQLETDTEFLKGLNIIDYSLLVLRVHWQNEPQDADFWGQLQRVKSVKAGEDGEGESYHMALIDFSQKWDFQKQGERWWKNLFGKKDTSAEQPSRYQSRFLRMVSDITPHTHIVRNNEQQSMNPSRMKRRQTELIFSQHLQQNPPT